MRSVRITMHPPKKCIIGFLVLEKAGHAFTVYVAEKRPKPKFKGTVLRDAQDSPTGACAISRREPKPKKSH